ncbi:MAG: hypothetical protein IT293_15230 [Deltaproteobacteria bacterium]|nr:hypothetical protein [Deltaproteobacteria bacterium]
MTRRRRKRGGATWWTIVLAIAAAGMLAWWFSARRAETPGLPASQPGARALSEAPGGPRAGQPDEHGHDEITGDEKAELERLIRERGAASPWH